MCSVVSEEAGEWEPRVGPGGRGRARRHFILLLLVSSHSLECLVKPGCKPLRAETVHASSA